MKIIGAYPALRMRRNRKADWIRRLVSEHNLSVSDLILPLFVKDGNKKKESIKSMPGIYRYSIKDLSKIVEKACKLKIPLIALFPYTKLNKKNKYGTEALNENNLICRSVKTLKKEFKKKIEEELKYTKGFLISVQKKLSNERFVSNAPDKVIEIERNKQSDAEAKIETLEKSLKGLQ